jgi:hypothetical protein
MKNTSLLNSKLTNIKIMHFGKLKKTDKILKKIKIVFFIFWNIHFPKYYLPIQKKLMDPLNLDHEKLFFLI